MASGDAAFFDEFLNGRLEAKETETIGDGGTIFSGALGGLFLREVKFLGEALEGMGLLDRIQIFALEIFHQRHLDGHFLGHVANHDGNATESGALRCTPTTFSSNQLEATG